SSFPNSALYEVTSHSHLVEADLLEFTDMVTAINGDTIDFLTTKTHAHILMDEENLNNVNAWHPNDIINLVYAGEGIYEAWNRNTENCSRVYLSDSIYSDLRNFEISKEMK